MINKSELRKTLREVLDDHDVLDSAILDDSMDAVVRDFGDDIYDDEDGDPEEQ